MSPAPLPFKPAPKETPATVRDVISVKSALADLLAQESKLMDEMRITQVGELQERKLKLTALLERYMRYLVKHPEALAQVTETEKAELKAVTETLHRAMKRNYDVLLVARAVNRSIVKCVTQIVTRRDNNPIYNARGGAGPVYASPISITLNQTI